MVAKTLYLCHVAHELYTGTVSVFSCWPLERSDDGGCQGFPAAETVRVHSEGAQYDRLGEDRNP